MYLILFYVQETTATEYQVINTVGSGSKRIFSIENVAKSGGGTTTVYLVPDSDSPFFIKGTTSDTNVDLWTVESITPP